MSEAGVEQLQERLAYRFDDPSLLDAALMHESFTNEQEGEAQSYERLEFLGDSVLGLAVAAYLYRRYPELPEGKLAQMKAHLVSTSHLAERARRLDLGRFVRLGRGEQLSAGRRRVSLLADALEAVIGAIYLDGGMPCAESLVLRLLKQDMDEGHGLRRDYKSLFQETTQKYFKALPEYQVVKAEGPPHARTFQVRVHFAGQLMGEGTGNSKREASQHAASQALEKVHRQAPEWMRLLEQFGALGEANEDE